MHQTRDLDYTDNQDKRAITQTSESVAQIKSWAEVHC